MTTTDVEMRPEAAVQRLLGGGLMSRTIYALCKVGVPELCRDRARSLAELAALTGTDPDALGRYLRLAVGVGLFRAGDDGFIATQAARLLCGDEPGSFRANVMLSNEVFEPTAAAVLYALRTGKPAFSFVHGEGFYEHLAANPDAEAVFAEAMSQRASRQHEAIIDAVDWSDVHHIVDIGGNRGGFLAAILRRLPGTTGVLFDQPQVVAWAERELDGAGVADRVDVVGGDFFVSVPAGGDLYLLANVLWNWSDPDAASILRRCRDVMASGARLLICEPVVPDDNEPHPARQADVVNFLLFGGRARRAEEWAALLGASGFVLDRIVPTSVEWSLLEARPS